MNSLFAKNASAERQRTRATSFQETSFADEQLFAAEYIVSESAGVVLANHNVSGILFLTNFRLIFFEKITKKVISLGSVPLPSIDKFRKEEPPAKATAKRKALTLRLIRISVKDGRIIFFGFAPKTRSRKAFLDDLSECLNPSSLWRAIFSIATAPSDLKISDPKERLSQEYLRLLGGQSDNGKWRISSANSDYGICSTYPSLLMVPSGVSDAEISEAATFRSGGRLPVISWVQSENGAVLARSSQPLVGLFGLKKKTRKNNADKKLLESFISKEVRAGFFEVAVMDSPCSAVNRTALVQFIKLFMPRFGHLLAKDKPLSLKDKSIAPDDSSIQVGLPKKLCIADARPRLNAFANEFRGGGTESSLDYCNSQVVFLGIENIHVMRHSFSKLRRYVNKLEAEVLDNTNGWLGASHAGLKETDWLVHIHAILYHSFRVASKIAEGSSVLVHCSDGWDRTPQLVSLASLLLDPYYRTFQGFQILVEKEWLAFGHKFATRFGLPTSENSVKPSSAEGCAPIFLQWVDCVAQLIHLYPSAFEFSLAYLVDLLDLVLSCRFGNFLFNNEKERQNAGMADSFNCLWSYLAHLQLSSTKNKGTCEHYNEKYDPQKHSGPVLSPSPVKPSLWLDFYVRWVSLSTVSERCSTMYDPPFAI